MSRGDQKTLLFMKRIPSSLLRERAWEKVSSRSGGEALLIWRGGGTTGSQGEFSNRVKVA